MDWREIAKRTEGLHTLDSFSRALGIRRGTAVLYIHDLRAAGFVKTMRGARGKRIYEISPLWLREIGSPGIFDTLNENSPLKLREPFEHRVYGRILSPEEAIVRALGTKDHRVILVSLEMFRKIRDFSLLYRLARREGLERQAGALYALCRRYFRVRRMDGRIMRRMKTSSAHSAKEKYIIEGMRSSDFTDIEKEWGVFVPFNKSDMKKLEVQHDRT